MARINPPGRLLYQNYLFDLKAVPNFEYWLKNLQRKEGSIEFLDYKFSDIGNLGIKKEIYMPNDNCIITDESVFIGNSIFKINQFEK